ncbi:MAG TPA: serine/threonine-protein kinase [Gemmatimonadales bacterium]|nr:serine/threonine-protein kinase [Gemmatimonadales bacterium]
MSHATRICPSCNTPLPGVASFCYVCGMATPTGIDMATGSRVAVSRSGITAADLRTRVQRILGPGYELGERIGAGGFAEVFKAQDLRLKRSVAVKVLRPDLGLTPGMLDRFRREAEVVAALRHPNIVPIFDIGEGEGIAFILMPLIEGESLRALMERDGAISARETTRILREAASGLAAAHDAGVIHRDIKPENIMLEGRESRVLLMDFGIAKAVGGEEDTPATDEGVAPALTSTGIIVGTPQYMSPEQACGDKTIDARTDQYSLAVVGYRMVSGTLPFEGDSTRAVLYQQLVAEPKPIIEKVPDIPAGLATVITRAMSKEPRERYDSMSAFRDALDQPGTVATVPPAKSTKASRKAAGKAAATPGVPKGTTNAPKSARTPERRRGLLVGGLLLAVVAVGFALTRGGGPRGAGDGFIPTSLFGGNSDDSSAAPPPDSMPSTGVTPAAPAPAPVKRPSPPPSPAPRGASSDRPTTTRRSAATSSRDTDVVAAPDCPALVRDGAWAEAVTACTEAANAGNAVAMRILGGMYDRGTGLKADPAQAFIWYKRAAPNDAEAQFELSRLYELGRGTPQDKKANIQALRGAASKGHQQATLTLASRLENGADMDRDYNEAAIWYQRAAERGSVNAMLKLADWAGRGRGIPKDPTAELGWYTKAADAGSRDGAWQAARMLLHIGSSSVPEDQARGMTMLLKAASLGQDDAAKELKKRTDG